MMKYFLVSCLILLLTGCATTSQTQRNVYLSPENSRLWTETLRDDEQLNRYQVSIQVGGNQITGICMLKKSDDSWRGTLINEFGVKAFDFIVTPQKCELLNTISMLNKWYIRRTIAGDLHFLFEIDNPTVSFQKKTVRSIDEQDGSLTIRYQKKKSVTRTSNNELTLNNLKRKIVYSLNVIHE